jgi:hypothetical protein
MDSLANLGAGPFDYDNPSPADRMKRLAARQRTLSPSVGNPTALARQACPQQHGQIRPRILVGLQ